MNIGYCPKKLSGLVVACLACIALAPIIHADPAPAPSAFRVIPTSGVGLSPAQFSAGQLTYMFTLSSGAHILYNDVEYPITLVWGLFAVNKTGSPANDFTASGPDIGAWKWDQKPNAGTTLSVGGWFNASKSEALQTPLMGSVSKQSAYSQFSYTNVVPLLGLHITVSIPEGQASPFGSGATGDIIPVAVPEPQTLFGLLLGAGMTGVSSLVRVLKKT